MTETINGENPSSLTPSCTTPEMDDAFPPVRLVELTDAPDSKGAGITLGSVCNSDWTGFAKRVLGAIPVD